MGKCVVKECESRSQKHNKSSGITFHTLPKDATRRKKWVEIIRLLRKETDWVPSKSTIICSKHFRDEDKLGPKSDCGRVYLSNEANPMLVDELLFEKPVDLLVEENMDDDVVETDEEIDEITESPQKHKMRKTIQRLKSVSTRRLKKIKNMAQKIKRLKTKNKKLKDVIEEMKQKMYVK
ncbi:unnamed protein product [Parnassius apollo]|uniref:(apollo) hypothetical protein n=1 Tax=Parnassius apollo TaxID=110799 RepID=A0A8S3W1D3_PARAO|nr:unnamed protein product [Parnassius apollo]